MSRPRLLARWLVVAPLLLVLAVIGSPGTAEVSAVRSGLDGIDQRAGLDQRAAVRFASDTVRPRPGRHKWRTINRRVPVVTGPNNDIEIEIDTRLYVPDNASRRRKQPAIVMTHGFGGSIDSTEILTTAKFFASQGYHVLTFTSSGFGGSGGCITLQSADYDVKSASQVITKVLGSRRDVKRDRKGVVAGIIGGSYGGGIQLPLAAADRRIRTAIVGRSWNDLSYSLNPNNYVRPRDRTGFTHTMNQQGVFKQMWTSLFYAAGNQQPASGNGGCPEAKQASGDPAEIAGAPSCPGYYLPLCRTYELLTATGDSDPEARSLIARASAATFMPSINIPTLLVQGQKDTLFNLNDAVATYVALRRKRVPVGMIWNSGGHGGWSSQRGECEAYDGRQRSVRTMSRCYLTLRSLGWMNHWLRGKPGGRGPGFAFYRPWVKYAGRGANDEQYAAVRRFPIRRYATTFTLSGSDGLVGPGATATTGSASFVNPSGGEPAAYSETSNFMGPDASPYSGDLPPREVEGQHVAFTTAPFKRRFIVAGVPAARLAITNNNGQDMVFFAKVYDVAPGGGTTLINRLIAPVRVPAAAVGAPVRIKLLGFVHRFRPGHRLRLVLASTDQTSYNAKVADVLTVTTGPSSTLRMPGR